MYQSLKKLEDKLEREDIKLSQNLRILIISKAKKPGDIERVVLHTGREAEAQRRVREESLCCEDRS